MLCLKFGLTELLAWLQSLTLCCTRNYSHPCRPEVLEYKVGTMHVVDTGTPARMAAVCLWKLPLQSRAEQGCVKTAFKAVQLYIVLCSATTKWKESYRFCFVFMCLFGLLFLFVFNPKHLNYVIWLCNFSVFESAVGMKTRSGHTLIHQCCCALLSVKRIWRNFKPTCISPVHIMEQFVFTLQRKKERKKNKSALCCSCGFSC